MKFIRITNFKTGKQSLLNLYYVDEIAPHESGQGTQIWSAKAGVKAYHVREEYAYFANATVS